MTIRAFAAVNGMEPFQPTETTWAWLITIGYYSPEAHGGVSSFEGTEIPPSPEHMVDVIKAEVKALLDPTLEEPLDLDEIMVSAWV
jgi:hypothetical protein